jgi:hypothetical protein
VQAPQQMDLEGDLSWMHSYRVMWLTYMLGCSANEEQQKELQLRSDWIAEKKKKDPKFETTKLEWARKLGDADIAILDDPLKNYGQMGLGGLPEGYKAVTLDELIAAYKDQLKKANGDPEGPDAKRAIESLRTRYDASKGAIVKVADPDRSFNGTDYEWFPHREAPAEEVKGLSRLKGHVQKGQWVTKFRKILRKDEMTDDLVLVPVPAGKEQEYVRIMPTSPP